MPPPRGRHHPPHQPVVLRPFIHPRRVVPASDNVTIVSESDNPMHDQTTPAQTHHRHVPQPHFPTIPHLFKHTQIPTPQQRLHADTRHLPTTPRHAQHAI